MKIIDTFIFYNEEKMIDFRLNYYKNTVDYFVIVEATKTFSGLDKPLHFNNIKDKYSHLNIIHIIVDDMPEGENAWDKEHHQRECIKRGLKLVPNIQEEDWILIADADEIANRDKLVTVKNSEWYSSSDKIGYTLEFDNYYYNLTSKLDHKCYVTKLVRYRELKNKLIKDMRFSATIYPLLIEFGWHFSYFFSSELIKNKIQAFAHQEFNNDKFTNKNHVEDCIRNGKSLFYLDPNRTEKIYHVPINNNNNLPENYQLLLNSYSKIKVRILEDTGCFLKNNNTYFSMPLNKLVSLFLPSTFDYEFVPITDKADICIFSIQLQDNSVLRKEEINIMICLENCSYWKHYNHYNKYGEYGNELVDIYMYNHINKLYKHNHYLSIPLIYMRINYYNSIKNVLYPTLNCSFDKKKFCLVINKSNLNNNTNIVIEKIKKYGQIDHISLYNQKILNASMYNSIELLEVFNQYKFIICFENSYNDGYITEKIFNCFLAKTIPIYSGSPIVENFLNKESFINIPHDKVDYVDLSMIEKLTTNECEYNEMLNKSKISSSYTDEKYMNEMIDIIYNKLNKRL